MLLLSHPYATTAIKAAQRILNISQGIAIFVDIEGGETPGGRYASEEETGEDMSQILVSILFSVLCQKGGAPHPAATTRGTAGRGSVPFTPQRRCARALAAS